MMLDAIERVIIIDDNKNEVQALQDMLESNDIDVTFFTPEQAKNNKLRKKRKLLFFDLLLDEEKNIQENVSTIRKIMTNLLPKDFGAYGLIIWSRNSNDIEKLKRGIQEDGEKSRYPVPLFILGLNKLKYLEDDNYDSLFIDLEEQLVKNKAAYFFLNWRNSIELASDNALNNMYHLVPNYNEQTKGFLYLLYQMAKKQSWT